MSGPKVVRIVTIEEVHAICNGWLAQLDAAIAGWERFCRANDAATEAEIAAMHQRRAEIAALMKAERYLDLQKRAPQEIQWIGVDRERRQEDVARRRAAERVRARRRATLAAQLLQRPSLTTEQRQGLQAIARGGEADERQTEALIGEVLRATPTSGAEIEGNAELMALAERLSEGQGVTTVDAWLATRDEGDSRAAQAIDKIDSTLANLALGVPPADIEALSERYRAILAVPPSKARQMRLDTLDFDIARRLEQQRQAERQLGELDRTIAEARAGLPPEHQAKMAAASAVLERRDATAAAAQVKTLRAALDEHRKKEATAARRRAVLTALAEAGYEAREGMATGQPDDGRLVLRRAANPDMGVEIAGGTAGARLQMRPVRFASASASSDTSRDRDIEMIWCSDFDRLNTALRAMNADVAIERATAVGATPVMVVETAAEGDERRGTSLPQLRDRRAT